jgi:Protein of unknown function (DUF2892)
MNPKPIVNVGQTERVVTGALAVALLASSIRISRPIALIGAACLFYRALSGNCKGYQALGVSTCEFKPKP